MPGPVKVTIIGAPIACEQGHRDDWRATAGWAAGWLRDRFGGAVQVEYIDLFDPACPPLPPNAQLPLVLVNGDVLSSGGKLPMPALRRRIVALLQASEPTA